VLCDVPMHVAAIQGDVAVVKRIVSIMIASNTSVIVAVNTKIVIKVL
jgi:hypothetical protein